MGKRVIVAFEPIVRTSGRAKIMDKVLGSEANEYPIAPAKKQATQEGGFVFCGEKTIGFELGASKQKFACSLTSVGI